MKEKVWCVCPSQETSSVFWSEKSKHLEISDQRPRGHPFLLLCFPCAHGKEEKLDIYKVFMKYKHWLSKCFWKYLDPLNRTDVFAKIFHPPVPGGFCQNPAPCRLLWWGASRKAPKSARPSNTLKTNCFPPPNFIIFPSWQRGSAGMCTTRILEADGVSQQQNVTNQILQHSPTKAEFHKSQASCSLCPEALRSSKKPLLKPEPFKGTGWHFLFDSGSPVLAYRTQCRHFINLTSHNEYLLGSGACPATLETRAVAVCSREYAAAPHGICIAHCHQGQKQALQCGTNLQRNTAELSAQETCWPPKRCSNLWAMRKVTSKICSASIPQNQKRHAIQHLSPPRHQAESRTQVQNENSWKCCLKTERKGGKKNTLIFLPSQVDY